jgi:Tol biopolymer transport system component
MSDHELERVLRGTLRETLDHQVGPHPLWAGSPAARRVADERRSRGRLPLRLLAVAALIAAGGGAALLGGALSPSPDLSSEAQNGWIALTVAQPDPVTQDLDGDTDIFLVGLDREPRLVIGTDTDDVNQLCPAFSPDGRSLAYGRVEGHGSDLSGPAAYQGAALVVADIADDGRASDRLTIDIGDGVPSPCPVWSPDGGRVAFGVNKTSPINPDTSAAGSEVWLVTLADRSTTVLPDLLATDIDWSPDGSQLAITSGQRELDSGNALQDGRIYLYEPSSGALRSLDATAGTYHLTWSPDGKRIAYQARDVLRVIDPVTQSQQVLDTGAGAIHGIGPVWSPDGKTIAYQRLLGSSGERHEVVLVTPGDTSDGTPAASERVIPALQLDTQGSPWHIYPFRVTWSPDGRYLLYLAWSTERSVGVLAAAVPTDAEKPMLVLPELAGLVPYDGYDDTSFVPIQTWARRPAS